MSENRTIWKYPIVIGAASVHRIPDGAEILCVQEQHGGVVLWAMVEPTRYKVARRFFVAPTGMGWTPPEACPEPRYIGTVQLPAPGLPGGIFVAHVFEEVATAETDNDSDK